MTTTNTILTASEKFQIDELVNTFDQKSVPELVVLLHKLFRKTLSTAHYIYLGVAIGQRGATLKRHPNNINNLLLWQRPN